LLAGNWWRIKMWLYASFWYSQLRFAGNCT